MKININQKIRNLLSNNILLFIIFSSIAAVATYTCMYALRKPIAVASFSGISYLGIDFKVLALSFQVIGYALSKFMGIKVIAEMQSIGRIRMLIILLGLATIALFLFAIIPYPYNSIALLFNGLPLGMIWGIVFSYLEGRRFTEILGAALSASFIFASGLVKSVGKYLIITFNVAEHWMPLLTGIIFFPILAISIYMLNLIPPPSTEDEVMRTKRQPMNGKERWEFFLKFAPGLILLTIIYIFLTIIRDFRDNFAVEIWTALGYPQSPEIFTTSEVPVAIFALAIVAVMFIIKNNFTAFMLSHILVLIGTIIILISSFLLNLKILDPYYWMIGIGTGLYIGYVPFNTFMFERLIAAFKYVSNIGFLIYLVDSFGYLGSTVLMIYKNFTHSTISWYDYFMFIIGTMPYIIMILTIFSMLYFYKKYYNDENLSSRIIPIKPKEIINNRYFN